MELKPGYKKTEIGIIPVDWDVDYIENIGHVTTGSKNTQDRIEDGDYPFFVRSQTIERINTYSFDGEAVLTAGDGVGTGKVFHYINGKFDVHQRVYRISGFSPRVNGHFFFLYFSRNFYNRIMQMTAKSSVDSVRRDMITRMMLPLPTIEGEQEAISQAIRDADALLDGLDRLIAKKRDLKQAAMQQLLTSKTRLPGFEGEWQPLNMAKNSTLKARIGWQGLTTAEYLESGQYALVTGTDFFDGKIDWDGCHFVEKERYDQDRYIQLQINDVLLTKDGTIGKATFVDQLPYPATLNSGVFVIRPKNGSYVPKYFFYVLRSQIFVDFLNKLQAGSTISHLYQKDFVNFEFLAPVTVEEQSAIVTVLSDMDAEIAALEQRRNKTKDIKQAMMQELLTGKTRLVEPQASDEQTDVASGNAKGHNWAINEAVVISTLVKHFGKEDFPLGRKRYTKLSYLLHRRVEQQAEGYLKKAAGPYNPQTKYGGPEKIAKQNGYITQHKGPKGHSGFIAADNIAQAEGYFEKWYGPEVIQWLEQFRYKKNDDLEVLATVDMAAVELRASGKTVDVATVKDVIASHPEWQAKLDRAAFSDANIAEAIKQIEVLMEFESVGGSHV